MNNIAKKGLLHRHGAPPELPLQALSPTRPQVAVLGVVHRFGIAMKKTLPDCSGRAAGLDMETAPNAVAGTLRPAVACLSSPASQPQQGWLRGQPRV